VILEGYIDCLELLLQHGADVNVPDIKAQTPLTMAVKNQHIKCVHALLVAGANPNGDARSLCSPLYIAAMNGYKDILEVDSLLFFIYKDRIGINYDNFNSTVNRITLLKYIVYIYIFCYVNLTKQPSV